MFEGGVIIWLVLAIITAFLAAKKNRSFIGWLIIGLLIPLIGFILILVMPAVEALGNNVNQAA